MGDLPEFWRATLAALPRGALAWRTPAEVAEALGRDVEETTDVLAELDVAGWIEVWDRPEGPAVTLSAWGAARLGVRLVEAGPDAAPRWQDVGDPEPPSAPARGVGRPAALADLDRIADPLPPPDCAAESAELAASTDAGQAARVKPGRLPFPSLLLGSSYSNAWPEPRANAVLTSICDVCRARPLAPHEYCLCCGRWGLDDLLRATRPPRAPRVTSAADPHRQVRDREVARALRKSRRAARLDKLRRADPRRRRAS